MTTSIGAPRTFAAKILHRHLGGLLCAAFPSQYGIGAAHVEDQPDLDDAVRDGAGRRRLRCGSAGEKRRGLGQRWLPIIVVLVS